MTTVTTSDNASRHESTGGALLPWAAALVTVVLWASAFVAIRHLGDDFSPGALTLGRLLLGSLVLGIVLATRSARWPSRRDWPRLLICGVGWFGIYNVSLNAAETRVDAGTAAMLVSIGPILVTVLAGWLLQEGFPPQLVAGSAVAFVGVIVIGTATSSRAGSDMWGVLLCAVAAIAFAIAVVAQKPLLASLPALEVTWWACTIGMVASLPFAPQLVRETGDADVSAIGWVIYLGALPTALAFTTWAYALARTTAGRLGVTTYLVPPIAIALGWALLGETPATLALVGGALCLAGVYVARRVPHGARLRS